MEKSDVDVIDRGQAALAKGHFLARQRPCFVIRNASPPAGHARRTRWNSLTLFTPARHGVLPGLTFPGEAEHHPGMVDRSGFSGHWFR